MEVLTEKYKIDEEKKSTESQVTENNELGIYETGNGPKTRNENTTEY